MTAAKLTNANLEGVNFSGARLDGVDFSYANLRGAILRGADFAGSNVEEADFTGADLSGADLSGGYRALKHGYIDKSLPRLRILFGYIDSRMGLETFITQRQLDGACGIDAKLPPGLVLKKCLPPAG